MILVLVGMRACGKTLLGRALADRLSVEFHDLDCVFEAEHGKTIKDFLANNSLDSFREIESALLEKYLNLPVNDSIQVLATGGGIVELAKNRQWLLSHSPVIFIDRFFADIYKTLVSDTTRPSLTGKSLAAESVVIYEKRLPHYKMVSDYVFSYSDSSEAWDLVLNRFTDFVKTDILGV